jgi:hypothetical protein
MSEKNDQITKNNHIVNIWNDINGEIHDIQKEGNLNNIADRAAAIIRVLRQGIERLRRVVEDGEPNKDEEDARIYSLADVWKLPKDVLVKVVWEFLQWHRSDDGECPALYCKDYPCQYKTERKKELAENLANGDLDQETYDKYMAEITEDMYDCDDTGEGCWASYYVWCYLNGYKPLEGKKPNNHK